MTPKEAALDLFSFFGTQFFKNSYTSFDSTALSLSF
jgi:hypothetical protein